MVLMDDVDTAQYPTGESCGCQRLFPPSQKDADWRLALIMIWTIVRYPSWKTADATVVRIPRRTVDFDGVNDAEDLPGFPDLKAVDAQGCSDKSKDNDNDGGKTQSAKNRSKYLRMR